MKELEELSESKKRDPNVTLEDSVVEQEYFPCPVCKRMLLVGYAKNDKPYCTCNICFVQLFVRGKEGIRMFKKLIGQNKVDLDTRDTINLIDQIKELRNKLEEIEDEQPIFGKNKDLDLQVRLIKGQLKILREKYQ